MARTPSPGCESKPAPKPGTSDVSGFFIPIDFEGIAFTYFYKWVWVLLLYLHHTNHPLTSHTMSFIIQSDAIANAIRQANDNPDYLTHLACVDICDIPNFFDIVISKRPWSKDEAQLWYSEMYNVDPDSVYCVVEHVVPSTNPKGLYIGNGFHPQAAAIFTPEQSAKVAGMMRRWGLRATVSFDGKKVGIAL